MDGVVRAPSAFSITLALFPSITETQELVVPRSIPIAFAMTRLLVSRGVRVAVTVEATHRSQCKRQDAASDCLLSICGTRKARKGERHARPAPACGVQAAFLAP